MPLLEVTQIKYINASVRMTDSTATQLNQYAHFINGSADDVIEEGLKHVFAKDREFQEFLKTPQAKDVASSLRVRKAPASESLSSQPKPPLRATQAQASTAGAKA